jgi:hypothetical protein
MFSQSLNSTELSAQLPRWAVFVSLALIALTTVILVLALPAHPGGNERPTTATVFPYYE